MDTVQRRMLIIGASFMVSFSAIFVRWSDAPSMTLVFYRMLFASLIVVTLAMFRWRGEFRTMGRDDIVLAILSGVVFAAHFASYFESLDHEIGRAHV